LVVEEIFKIIEEKKLQNDENLAKLDTFLKKHSLHSTALIARLIILKNVGSVRYISELRKCALYVQSRKKLFDILSKNKINARLEINQNFNQKLTILEWIEKIEKKEDNPSFFSATETAKKSLDENDDFITETLAKIYKEQGHYNKAIDAFEKLILKFPEKNTLFASQISEIKKIK
jgi:tetratricopeptide (TPR) repeat protein